LRVNLNRLAGEQDQADLGSPIQDASVRKETVLTAVIPEAVSQSDVEIMSESTARASLLQKQKQGKPDSPSSVLSSQPSHSAFRVRSMAKPMKFISEYDGEIRRLKDDLYQARRAIICLMPEPVQEILGTYYRCTSRMELHQWESNVIDQLVELAKPIPRRTAHDNERAYCPLCSGSAQSLYEEQQGFSLPIGLRRHLEGWGNTHQCDVTVAAFRLARDWAHDKFHEIEQQEHAEAEAKLAARRARETLYQTGPHSEPELMGGRYQWRPVRNHKSLSWAEERLEELGFKKMLRDRVKSYIHEHPGVFVYADPREEGRIEFFVYRFPPPPVLRKSRRGPNFEPRPHFSLSDAWKNDLQGKYSERLDQAIAALGSGQVPR
jgi:hypothetical protein